MHVNDFLVYGSSTPAFVHCSFCVPHRTVRRTLNSNLGRVWVASATSMADMRGICRAATCRRSSLSCTSCGGGANGRLAHQTAGGRVASTQLSNAHTDGVGLNIRARRHVQPSKKPSIWM